MRRPDPPGPGTGGWNRADARMAIGGSGRARGSERPRSGARSDAAGTPESAPGRGAFGSDRAPSSLPPPDGLPLGERGGRGACLPFHRAPTGATRTPETSASDRSVVSGRPRDPGAPSPARAAATPLGGALPVPAGGPGSGVATEPGEPDSSNPALPGGSRGRGEAGAKGRSAACTMIREEGRGRPGTGSMRARAARDRIPDAGV